MPSVPRAKIEPRVRRAARRLAEQHLIRALTLLALSALAVAPPELPSQTALSIRPTQCVAHSGDNPAWAASDLDQSDWTPAAQWKGLESPQPHFWLRCQLDPGRLNPGVSPVLQVTGDLSYEIYVDGRLSGRFGDLRSGNHTVGVVSQYKSLAFEARGRPFLLALRMTYSPTKDGEGPLPQISLGDAGLQRGQYSIEVAHNLASHWLTWVCYGLIAAAGMFFFTLYWFDRTQIYLLWVSLTWLCLALRRLGEFLVAASIHFPSRLEIWFYALGNLELFFCILFYFALAGRPLNRFYRVILLIEAALAGCLLLAAVLPLHASMALRWFVDIDPAVNSVIIPVAVVAALAPLAAFWPFTSLRRSQIALFSVCCLWMLMDALYLGAQAPWLSLGDDTFRQFQPARSAAIAAVVVALTFLLVHRIRSTNRQRAALAGEMEAAAQIQRLIVPSSFDIAPGLKIESVFLPAQEVGGDFYRCLRLPEGAQRVIIGDVSGNGAAAAMTAAMLLGAADGHETASPAAVLTHLNRIFGRSGVGGFATCLCVDLAPGGEIVIANAGHLAPYRNGLELLLDSGLPLGVSPKAVYAQTVHHLATGDTLTLISDGVVEARSPEGELFGFERTQAISTESAGDIAETARIFGQQDDITVLTVTFDPSRLSAA